MAFSPLLCGHWHLSGKSIVIWSKLCRWSEWYIMLQLVSIKRRGAKNRGTVSMCRTVFIITKMKRFHRCSDKTRRLKVCMVAVSGF